MLEMSANSHLVTGLKAVLNRHTCRKDALHVDVLL